MALICFLGPSFNLEKELTACLGFHPAMVSILDTKDQIRQDIMQGYFNLSVPITTLVSHLMQFRVNNRLLLAKSLPYTSDDHFILKAANKWQQQSANTKETHVVWGEPGFATRHLRHTCSDLPLFIAGQNLSFFLLVLSNPLQCILFNHLHNKASSLREQCDSYLEQVKWVLTLEGRYPAKVKHLHFDELNEQFLQQLCQMVLLPYEEEWAADVMQSWRITCDNINLQDVPYDLQYYFSWQLQNEIRSTDSRLIKTVFQQLYNRYAVKDVALGSVEVQHPTSVPTVATST